MKLRIAKDQLLRGLQTVQNIVGVRSTLPILSNVLLRAEGTELKLTATDLDVTIGCAVAAEVQSPGMGTVPVKRLFSIVRELMVPELEMEFDDKHSLKLSAGASFYRIMGLAAEEFPPLPKFEEAKRVKIPQAELGAMLRKTSYAISMDESRFVLNGIFFVVKEQKISLVATDGRRLALAEGTLPESEQTQVEFIVPTKAINELTRLLQATGEIEIKWRESQCAFFLQGEGASSTAIMTKLVEGTYPNYRQVIPAESKERIALSREELLHALRRAEIMTTEKSNSVKLSFSKNSLSITANTPELGEGRENLAINYKGPDLAVAFNPGYLMDPLKALEEDEVFLELTDDLSPGVLKVNSPFLYVLMPMRMSG